MLKMGYWWSPRTRTDSQNGSRNYSSFRMTCRNFWSNCRTGMSSWRLSSMGFWYGSRCSTPGRWKFRSFGTINRELFALSVFDFYRSYQNHWNCSNTTWFLHTNRSSCRGNSWACGEFESRARSNLWERWGQTAIERDTPAKPSKNVGIFSANFWPPPRV